MFSYLKNKAAPKSLSLQIRATAKVQKFFYINLVLSQKGQFTKSLLDVHGVSFEINFAFPTIGIQDQTISFNVKTSLNIDTHFKKQLPFYYSKFIASRILSQFRFK